jgi:ribosomal protein L12E/L44/L45/RPP1/RPP2
MPESYIKFLIQSLTGVDVDQRLVDISAVFVLVLASGASALLNIKDWRKSRKTSKAS